MIEWSDSGIVLGRRRHGASGAVVSLHTAHHGRIAGYVYAIRDAGQRSLWLTGNAVTITWRGRLTQDLGHLDGGLDASPAADLVDHPARLAAVAAACSLVHAATPERQPAPDIHRALARLLLEDIFTPSWRTAYAEWEAALSAGSGYGRPPESDQRSNGPEIPLVRRRLAASGRHLAEKAFSAPRSRLPALRSVFGQIVNTSAFLPPRSQMETF